MFVAHERIISKNIAFFFFFNIYIPYCNFRLCEVRSPAARRSLSRNWRRPHTLQLSEWPLTPRFVQSPLWLQVGLGNTSPFTLSLLSIAYIRLLSRAASLLLHHRGVSSPPPSLSSRSHFFFSQRELCVKTWVATDCRAQTAAVRNPDPSVLWFLSCRLILDPMSSHPRYTFM